MITISAFGSRQAAMVGTMGGMPAMLACSVRLIDRRTGRTHRVNGAPMVVQSREPHRTASEMLRGRDPAIWEARIEVLRPEGQ